jgi:transposase
MKHTCGIDWASDHHDVSVVNNSGIEVKHFRISDDLEGYNQLLKTLKAYRNKPPIAIECKEHLVISFLVCEGYTVYSINPKSLDRYKDRYNIAGNKTDPIDAFALADALRTDIHKHYPLAYSSENIRKLQMYCKEYDKLNKTKNIIECQVGELLNHYYPIVLTLFGERSWTTMMRFIIQYPAVKTLNGLSYEEFKNSLHKIHYNNNVKINQMYEKIKTGGHYQNDLFDEVYSASTMALAKSLLVLLDEIKKLTDKMTEIVDNHSLGKIFKSLPASGEIMSAKLLSVMGDNKSLYESCQEIQSLAGLVPVIKESGKTSYAIFRHACNKEYRDIITWYAFCSMNKCPWARAFYNKKREEGKRHFETLRLLGFKWMRIIYTLWKEEKVYDESYHLYNLNRFKVKAREVERKGA